MRWTEEQKLEAWNKKSPKEQKVYGSYTKWKKGIIEEIGEDDYQEVP